MSARKRGKAPQGLRTKAAFHRNRHSRAAGNDIPGGLISFAETRIGGEAVRSQDRVTLDGTLDPGPVR